MSSPGDRNLKQVVTYWAPTFVRSDFGAETYSAPVTLIGRWSDVVELVTDVRGEEFTSKAIVRVPEDVQSEGYLALGDHTVTPSPLDVPGAQRIRAFRSIVDLRNVGRSRKAYL